MAYNWIVDNNGNDDLGRKFSVSQEIDTRKHLNCYFDVLNRVKFDRFFIYCMIFIIIYRL